MAQAGRRGALATLCAVLFLTFLDTTIVSVALADIQNDLHPGVVTLQWVVNGYALVFAALMLTGGTLGDLFGRKRVLLAGIAVFCAGSVLAALAPDAGTLVAGRAVMGVGAAASEPGTLSLLRHVYPDGRSRDRALGVWAAVSGLALAAGPVLGGAIVGVSGWREVFWFNLAFGAVAFAAAAITLPESADRAGRRVDTAGLALSAATLATVTFAIISGEDSGYTTWWIDLLFALAAAGAVAFVLVERRVASPAVDLTCFRHPAFAVANWTAGAVYFGVFALFFFVALYLQLVANASAYRTAAAFAPMAAGMVAASLLTGRWVAASGPRAPMTAGCLLGAAGVLLTDAALSPAPRLVTVAAAMAVAGIGFGTAIVPVTSTALEVVPAERSGMAASITNTSREVGAVLAVAVLGAIVDAQLTGNLVAKLDRIGIPRQFDQLVIHAVTHGTVPQNPATAASQAGVDQSYAGIVAQVIRAAEQAFGDGVNVALLLSGALLLGAAALVLLTLRPQTYQRRWGLWTRPDPTGSSPAGR